MYILVHAGIERILRVPESNDAVGTTIFETQFIDEASAPAEVTSEKAFK